MRASTSRPVRAGGPGDTMWHWALGNCAVFDLRGMEFLHAVQLFSLGPALYRSRHRIDIAGAAESRNVATSITCGEFLQPR